MTVKNANTMLLNLTQAVMQLSEAPRSVLQGQEPTRQTSITMLAPTSLSQLLQGTMASAPEQVLRMLSQVTQRVQLKALHMELHSITNL